MDATKEALSSLDACKGPPILMGDDMPGTKMRVEFTPDAVNIYDIQNNSKVATGEVNHRSRLYTFSEFIEPDFSLLLTHAGDNSRLWHKIFGHLNFR